MSDPKSYHDTQWAIYKDRILKLLKNHTPDLRNTTGALPLTQVPILPEGKIEDGAITPAKLSFDPATQVELDAEAAARLAADTAEAAARAAADSTHASLTTTAHGGIVASSDSRLSDSRTPTAHASTHIGAGSDPITIAESQVTNLTTDLAAKQPLDSDLTAIAALSTTSFGRALLALADAAALRTAGGLGTAAVADTGTGAANVPTITQADARYQPLDSDLTAIASLTTTSYGRSVLALADAAALRTLAGLGSLAVLSTITASLISDASANGRSLITASDYAAMRTLLGLVIGTNVQAWDADLDAIASLTTTSYGRSYLAAADAAAARVLAAAAPLSATYIMQTANSETSAEQALSALATGYMKVTTSTGVITSQAPPIPVADGGTGVAAIPAFSVHKNGTDQTVATAAGVVKLSWPTEVFDSNNNFASDRFTPTIVGKYLLACSIVMTPTTDAALFLLRIYKNGALYKDAAFRANGTNYQGFSVSAVVDANGSSDYFEMYYYHECAGNANVSGAAQYTHWSGAWVGP
jgi:acid phosphatase family membrane protein YuiD